MELYGLDNIDTLTEYIYGALNDKMALDVKKPEKEKLKTARELADFVLHNTTDNKDEKYNDEKYRKNILKKVFVYDFFEIFNLNDTINGSKAKKVNFSNYLFLETIKSINETTIKLDVEENKEEISNEDKLISEIDKYTLPDIQEKEEQLINSKEKQELFKLLTFTYKSINEIFNNSYKKNYNRITEENIDREIIDQEKAILKAENMKDKKEILSKIKGMFSFILKFKLLPDGYVDNIDFNSKYFNEEEIETIKRLLSKIEEIMKKEDFLKLNSVLLEINKEIEQLKDILSHSSKSDLTDKIIPLVIAKRQKATESLPNKKTEYDKLVLDIEFNVNMISKIKKEKKLLNNQEAAKDKLMEFHIQRIDGMDNDGTYHYDYMQYTNHNLIQYMIKEIKEDYYNKFGNYDLKEIDMLNYLTPEFIEYIKSKEVVYEQVSSVESTNLYQENYLRNNFLLLEFNKLFNLEIAEPLKEVLENEHFDMLMYIAKRIENDKGVHNDNTQKETQTTMIKPGEEF